jgi:hypothetical protein
MTINVLKDVLISKNQINRYYEGATPLNLWRALNAKRNTHPFEFVEQPFMLSNGRPRPADIKIEKIQGKKWVIVRDRPRGISTFDKPGVPAGKDWEYYIIPKGTVLPYGLAIVKDEYNNRFNATHYTLAPAFDMPLSRFKTLLNQLAQNLIREAV